VVENLLELGSSFLALSRRQVRLPANVGWVQARNLGDELDLPVLSGRHSTLQIFECLSRSLAVERQLRLDSGQPQRLHLFSG
jgi:hypothetical protein